MKKQATELYIQYHLNYVKKHKWVRDHKYIPTFMEMNQNINRGHYIEKDLHTIFVFLFLFFLKYTNVLQWGFINLKSGENIKTTERRVTIFVEQWLQRSHLEFC